MMYAHRPPRRCSIRSMNALLLSFFLAYAGFVALCLSMNRHHQQVFSTALSAPRSRVLRSMGWVLVASSVIPCVMQWKAALGVSIWVGVLTASSVPLVLLLPYAPRVATGGVPIAVSLLLAISFAQ
jgi:hypothetical protein